MKIQIDKIQLDPNQPRKIVDEKSVINLAKSLKVEGLIHPIEVDEDFRIIVGEMRYRAAKSLGWTEIEANIHKALTPYERLRRQMAENLQQSGAKGGGQPMNAIDTARGWSMLMKLKTGTDYRPGRTSREDVYGIVKTMGEEVGVDYDTIYQHLELLEQPDYVIKDLLRGRPRTFYREAEGLPEKVKGVEVKEPIKRAISEGKVENREDIRRLKRTLIVKPEKAEIEVARIIGDQRKDVNSILNRGLDLQVALKNATPEKWDRTDKNMVRSQLGSLNGTIRNFLGGLK